MVVDHWNVNTRVSVAEQEGHYNNLHSVQYEITVLIFAIPIFIITIVIIIIIIIIIIVMTLPGVFAGNPGNRNTTGSGRVWVTNWDLSEPSD